MALAVTASAALALAACSGGDEEPAAAGTSSSDGSELSGTITAAEWGGVWDSALQVVTPGFTEATGVDVVNSVNSGSVLAMLEQNPGLYDLAWNIGTSGVQSLQQGLVEPIDTSRIENLDAINPTLLDALTVDGELAGVPISFGTEGILYRKDLVPFEITSWEDLWDPRLEGQVTIQNAPSIGGLFVMMAGGEVFGDGIEDIDAGFEAMEELEPNIQSLYANSAEPINALASGSASVAVTFANYGVDLADQDVEIVIPEGGSAWSLQAISIPVDAPNKDAAYAFINYMLEQETQVAWADAAAIAPARSDVELPEDVQAKVRETPEVAAEIWPIDWVWFGDNVDAWTTRWQEIFTQ
ncbi:MAG TPA: extracellular solute-binding protein [Cellulomonas sp.]